MKLQTMLKKISAIIIIVLFVIVSITMIPHEKVHRVTEIISPKEILLDSAHFEFKDYNTFDPYFSKNNLELAKQLNLSETEAFIIGNLGKYWAENHLKGRFVYIKNNSDLIYYRNSYLAKFLYSGYCFKDSRPFFEYKFNQIVDSVRKSKYYVLDLDSDYIYETSDPKIKGLKNFLVLRKNHLPKQSVKSMQAESRSFGFSNLSQDFPYVSPLYLPPKVIKQGDIKIYFADSTTKLLPDRNCSSDICKEILQNINSTQNSLDIAVYGYSSTPQIEEALKSAIKRGVNVRLVYDIDSQGNNIYEHTYLLTKIIPQNISDLASAEVRNIMHNKFYIFDDKKVITGSANLSHTDMSGFNTNSIILINSPEVAKLYKQEFEQLYNGKFHNAKISFPNKRIKVSNIELEIYFSPQDKAITNAVLPLIEKAKEYIYIPTFVLTEKRVADALINAHKRGVDVKVIIDALSASNAFTKHELLRQSGISVKTENYAGKMHSKSLIVDDKSTIIGSMNFSNSGEKRNDENLVLINDPKITKMYKEFFLYQWNRIDDKWLKYNVRAEGKDSIGSCSDGLDNNYDGLIDKEDVACK